MMTPERAAEIRAELEGIDAEFWGTDVHGLRRDLDVALQLADELLREVEQA